MFVKSLPIYLSVSSRDVRWGLRNQEQDENLKTEKKERKKFYKFDTNPKPFFGLFSTQTQSFG